MKRHTRNLIKLICETIAEPDGPLLGAEIGIWRGHTSLGLLTAFPKLTLVCVDPWDTGGDQSTMGDDAQRLTEARLEFIAATAFAKDRRIIVETESVTAATCFPARHLDFLFLDGCHTYEAVKSDVSAWWEKLKRGGLFAGHDYDGRGDKTGRFGVKRAVDEWAMSTGYKVQTAPGLLWWVRK